MIGYCLQEGIATIVIGELTGIRDSIDYGKKINQKLHQWIFRKLTEMISYKAKICGD